MKLKLLILAWVLTLGIFFLNCTTPANAQTASTSANYFSTEANVPINLHTYTQSVILDLASTASCILSGEDPVDPSAKCLGYNPTTHKIGYMEGGGGLMGVMGTLIASTFYMPINTHQYMDYVSSNFGISKQTYAQESLGFNALLPTLTMWKAFRNITYMIFTLIFIVIGVGIMFRIKLDPRTVMGLQNTIPKIILALIFITFSYAIAGFLVDMMYVSIYVVISVFAQQGFDTSSAVASNPFSAIGGLGGMHEIASGVSGSIAGVVSDFFSGTIGNVVGGMIGGLIGILLPTVGSRSSIDIAPFGVGVHLNVGDVVDVVKTAVGFGGGALFGNKTVGLFANILTYLIVMIAMLSALFRLWFMLIKCYISVFLTVVFGPFAIAAGVLPGQSGIGGWFKGMLANLIVFPTTIVMFLLGASFVSAFQTPPGENVKPFLPPLMGGFIHPDQVSAIIGLGIILLTPEVANMMKEALKVADSKQGTAIGRSLGAGAGVLTAPLGATWGALTRVNQQGQGVGSISRRFSQSQNPWVRRVGSVLFRTHT